ncbi:signal peptidase II [bacterium (candidate division B38) B3_B38]|nr:MAG: signal peptidase II [bacterium (candidate division B38) B3_B38]
MNKHREKALWGLIVALILLLDQGSKYLIHSYIGRYRQIDVIPHLLNITYVENRGGAFGIFATSESPLKPLIFSSLSIIALIIIIYFSIKLPLKERWARFGLSLIFGGAVGNFADRLRLGFVIDFIDLHWRRLHWPSFNFADVAICTGVAMLIITTFKPRAEGKATGTL